MKPVIDLTRNHFVRPGGDLVCVGTWLWNDDQQDYEPCLVIVPRYRRRGFKPCVVALSSAWRYNPEHNGPAYLAHMSKMFLHALSMDDCMTNAYKVAEVIQNNLGDLIKMPNNPMSSIITADATFSFDDGTRRTVEVVDYKPMAQA